jgi:hypothetical protein
MSRRALVAAALMAAAAAVAPATAGAAPRSLIEDDASLLRSGPVLRERTLDDMALLGADTVRIIVLWREAPGVWPALDAAVAGARARGLDVLLTLTGPGPASASGCTPRDGACRPDPAAYGRFVAEAGARYPQVTRWSLWNEPNIPNWLAPQRVARGGQAVLVAPALYRALARAGAGALAATGHGEDTILVGESAPVPAGTTGPPARRATTPLAFARALLAAPVPGTGWAHHAYSAGGVRDPAASGRREQLGPAALGVLDAELAAARRRGATDRRFGIWLTEGGFQTDPPDPFFGVAPATQAAWMNELDWLASRAPSVRSVAQYLVRDERALSSFQSGVRFADGRRKPSFDAYRAPLWARPSGATRVVVWGRVRPRGATLVALERRPPGALRWVVIATVRGRAVERRVPAGRSGTRWRLRWRDAAGGRHVSRAARAIAAPSAGGR